MWGFVSVMLALLFLLMPTMASYNDLPIHGVDLTETHHAAEMPRALRDDAIRIEVDSDGTIYFRDQRVLSSQLPGLIREGIRNGAERKVYVSADARAKYGRVEQVLNEVSLAGIEKLCFLTWQR
jgi:biopolymer transport protein ExbD